MKFCKDCDLFLPDGKKKMLGGYSNYAITYGKCMHGTSADPMANGIHAVTGKMPPRASLYKYAQLMRLGYSEGHCGPYGKYFKAKTHD
jgi:hypothetical protein